MAGAVLVLHEDCDPEKANDKDLPYTSYLVKYLKDGKQTQDI